MKQLTMNQLASYIPHGLRVIEGRIECSLTGSYADQIIENPILYEDIRLIVRPLSSLTREIEHNGERFVPMVELAKMYHKNDRYTVTHYEGLTNTGDWYKVNCCVENDSSRYTYFQVSKDMQEVEYKIIQHLFEWHFDVFGLIEAGLAIERKEEQP